MTSPLPTAAPVRVAVEGYEAVLADLPGGHTVAVETHMADADPAALFRGLPGDRCQCPHWGYVIEGRITFRYADREETFEAGHAYHAAPGHTPVTHAGTRIVEFSPTAELARTASVVTGNLRAAGMIP